MTERCRLCRQPIFPSDGAVRAESGWVAHMLCVMARDQQRRRQPNQWEQDATSTPMGGTAPGTRRHSRRLPGAE
jgi:hypothetical protein